MILNAASRLAHITDLDTFGLWIFNFWHSFVFVRYPLILVGWTSRMVGDRSGVCTRSAYSRLSSGIPCIYGSPDIVGGD